MTEDGGGLKRQTMSDMVMLYNLRNKRCACEKKKKIKQIIKCSKYSDKTEPTISLLALFSF